MIIYTKHARERLSFRKIESKWISDTIFNPDRLVDAKSNRKQAIKKINDDKISVICVKENSNYIIITVYWGV